MQIQICRKNVSPKLSKLHKVALEIWLLWMLTLQWSACTFSPSDDNKMLMMCGAGFATSFGRLPMRRWRTERFTWILLRFRIKRGEQQPNQPLRLFKSAWVPQTSFIALQEGAIMVQWQEWSGSTGLRCLYTQHNNSIPSCKLLTSITDTYHRYIQKMQVSWNRSHK